MHPCSKPLPCDDRIRTQKLRVSHLPFFRHILRYGRGFFPGAVLLLAAMGAVQMATVSLKLLQPKDSYGFYDAIHFPHESRVIHGVNRTLGPVLAVSLDRKG
jgi:hypothetical protein